MKKLFTLFAMAMMTIGANAQTLIAEKDFTGGFEGDNPYTFLGFPNVEGSVSSDPDGVAITIGSKNLTFWAASLTIFPEDSFSLNPKGNYKVVVTAKFPTDGMLGITIDELYGMTMMSYSSAYVTTTGDFQEVEIEVSALGNDFESNGCEMKFHCGEFQGTTILKKVQIYEMEVGEENIDGLTYYIDKTNKTAAVKKSYQINEIVEIPATITHKGEEYTVTKILNRVFGGWNGLTSVIIPDGVTFIGYGAFNSCYNLQEITIPASVTVISQEAIAYCDRLNRVTILAETPPLIYENAFSNYNAILKVPDASMDVYKSTPPWNKFSEFELMSKQKCATPKICVEDGKLNFSCDTEGVEYHYEIFTSIKGDGNGIKLPKTFNISVYASKEGWYDSVAETGEVPVSVIADANGDGVVDAADIVRIVNIIMGQ
ncbi:MAG: leucine-rich repeat protein [Prevotella sp.]|nr:leucine-rich repeat protein [Prevotella sp.]